MRDAKSKWLSVLLVLAAVPSLCLQGLTATPVNPMRRWFESGEYEASQGHYEKALRMYERLLPLWRTRPQLHTAVGDAQLGLGRYGSAIVSYSEALRVSPGSAPARLGLARAAARSGDRVQALRQLEDLERIAPRHEPGYLLRSQLLREQGDPDAALGLDHSRHRLRQHLPDV